MSSSILQRTAGIVQSVAGSFAAAQEIERTVIADWPTDRVFQSDDLHLVQQVFKRHEAQSRHDNATASSFAAQPKPDPAIRACVKHARDELRIAQARLASELKRVDPRGTENDRHLTWLQTERTRIAAALFALEADIAPKEESAMA